MIQWSMSKEPKQALPRTVVLASLSQSPRLLAAVAELEVVRPGKSLAADRHVQ